MRTPDSEIRRISLSVAAFLVLAVAGCSTPVAEAEPAAETEPDEADAAHEPGLIRLDQEAIRIAGLTLAVAEIGKLEIELQVPGRITINQDATARVGSIAEGLVVACCESVGTDVEKGQVLARLHSHEVHDGEASYWEARAELERRRTELQFARETYQRASRLHELKAGSLQKVQEAESKLRSAEMFLEIAKAGVKRTEIHLRYLGLSPERLPSAPGEHRRAHEEQHLIEVRAPVRGTIIERMVTPGAVVAPSDSLYVISDLTSLWVIAQVPERRLSSLRNGQPVKVSVRAYPGRTFPARITYIGDALDPETRTVEVRCELKNPGRRLKREMFATIAIGAGAGREAVVAPLAALQDVDGEEVLFVPEGETSFRVRRVRAGRRSGSMVEIVSGLQAGEAVVVNGAFHLKSELLKARMVGHHH